MVVMHLQFGCITDGGYYHSLIGNWLLVVVVILLVVSQYFYRESRDAKVVISEEDQLQQARTLFNRFDKDRQGIKLEEVALVVRKIDPKATDEQVKAIFQSGDTDGSGVINFDEFFAKTKGGVDGDNVAGEPQALDLGLVVKQQLKADRQSDALTKVFLLVFLLYRKLMPAIILHS